MVLLQEKRRKIMKLKEAWSIWIDENKKVIFSYEKNNAKQIWFESKRVGLEKISKLLSNGYKIG